MKACIIVPPAPFLDDERVFPPLGPLYIKRYVEEHTLHEVDILDDGERDVSAYDVVGFTCNNATIDYVVDFIAGLPAGKVVVIGGPHAQYYFDRVPPSVHVVVGDGCRAFLQILDGNVGNTRVVGGPLDNPDQLPARDGVSEKYNFAFPAGVRGTTMITARGCPNHCYFCSEQRGRVDLKSLEACDKELGEIRALGFKGVVFNDDLFCISETRLWGLTDLAAKHGIIYKCNAHAHNFTPAMADMLAWSGCYEVGFGAESGSTRILRGVNKKSTAGENYRLVRLLKAAGIPRVKAYLILGLPGETMETMEETYDFVKNSGIDDFNAYIYRPFKGTYIYDHVGAFDLEILNEDDGGPIITKGGCAPFCNVRTSALSAEDIIAFQERLRRLKPGVTV